MGSALNMKNAFTSPLYLLCHTFQKKPPTFYNISLSSLRTYLHLQKKETEERHKQESEFMGHIKRKKTTKKGVDGSPAVQMASSED